jgi:hypothetical protein
MVPHFLDERPWKTMDHGSRAFVPSVNPVSTQKKEKRTHDFFQAHVFFFDSHNLHYLSIKIKCCKKLYFFITRRDPRMWRLYIIFYLSKMHYNWKFSKKAYEFKFKPWKVQLTSLKNFDSTFVIGSNLYYMESLLWLNKTLWKKTNNELKYWITTLVQKTSTSQSAL